MSCRRDDEWQDMAVHLKSNGFAGILGPRMIDRAENIDSWLLDAAFRTKPIPDAIDWPSEAPKAAIFVIIRDFVHRGALNKASLECRVGDHVLLHCALVVKLAQQRFDRSSVPATGFILGQKAVHPIGILNGFVVNRHLKKLASQLQQSGGPQHKEP